MKVLFVGSVNFSKDTLQALIDENVNIAGVCTLEKSTFNADHFDLKEIAKNHGIPTVYAPDINSKEIFAWIREIGPDVIFCFGWSRLIKKQILDLPQLGVIGFHPAELPANRGRHPIIWALALGLKKTASTFFFMDERADSGDILSQEIVEINEKDDASSLYIKITSIAINQIKEFVPRLGKGSIKRLGQDEKLSNVWRKRGKADGQIDWRMSTEGIHNLVRALTRPYVGAHFYFSGQEFKVWKTKKEQCLSENIEPGKILNMNENGILVKTGSGAIWLTEHEFCSNLRVGDYL